MNNHIHSFGKKYFLGFGISYLAILAITVLLMSGLKQQGKLPPPPFNANFSFNTKVDFLKKRGTKCIADCRILAIGSSMTLNNLDSTVFEDATSKPEILNTAFWASKIRDTRQMAEIILKHSHPKIVILVCSTADFFDEPSQFSGNAAPAKVEHYVFGKNPIPFQITSFDLRYYWRAYKELIPLQTKTNTAYTLKYDFAGDAPIGIYDFKSDKRWNFPIEYPPENSTQYVEFKQLIDLLQSRGIYLICSQSPIRRDTRQKGLQQLKQHWQHLNEILANQRLPFYNFGESLSLDDSYFADSLHLNQKGATVYTKALLEACRPQIEKALK